MIDTRAVAQLFDQPADARVDSTSALAGFVGVVGLAHGYVGLAHGY